ncbi:type II secretion system F family protein [Alicyclobacillus suci]|uniref:type II secretion system F family protein n=1 Tax=Alicyclobacillus suci TaxID=2816080 RepID=UPI001A90957A|nr:type II secretion system F family protein [Alicyclobacillus suci]
MWIARLRKSLSQRFQMVSWVRNRPQYSADRQWMRWKQRAQFLAFAENFAELLEAGVGVLVALARLAESGSRFQRSLSQSLFAYVERGLPVSGLFEPYVDLISARALIVAENVGQLPAALSSYAHRERQRRAWRQSLVKSLTYPCLLLVSCFALALFVRLQIDPELASLQASLNQAPGLAHGYIQSVLFNLSLYLMVIILACPLVYLGLLFGRRKLRWQGLHLPFDELTRAIRSEQFVDSVQKQLEAGLSLIEALGALEPGPDTWLCRQYQFVLGNLLDGKRLAESLPSSVSPVVWDLLSVSELTGDVMSGLARADSVLRGQIARALEKLSHWLEPVAMSVMGLVVGTTMYSVFGPMYQTISSSQ